MLILYHYYTDKNCLCQLFKTNFVYNFYMNIQFSSILRTLRNDAGLKQEELASSLEVTQRKISYWETGKIEPDLSSLWKIADFFDVSIDFLIGRKEY